jgi:hypothetical protein
MMSHFSLSSPTRLAVQRIPRYVLLLKELRKNTHPKDADYQALEQALSKVSGESSFDACHRVTLFRPRVFCPLSLLEFSQV